MELCPLTSNTTTSNATDQRRRNVRLALILASVAVCFFLGFVAKIALFSHA